MENDFKSKQQEQLGKLKRAKEMLQLIKKPCDMGSNFIEDIELSLEGLAIKKIHA